MFCVGESSRYRGNVPAVSEEELQAVRVGGLDGLTDIYQPHLRHTDRRQRSTDSKQACGGRKRKERQNQQPRFHPNVKSQVLTEFRENLQKKMQMNVCV